MRAFVSNASLVLSVILCVGSAYAAPPENGINPGSGNRATRPVVGPVPAWVLPAPVAAAPTATGGAAVVDLLADQQARLIDGGDAVYRANVFRIASAEGLDAGALEITWDPSLEQLTIHRYRILRKGKAIDLLGNGSRLDVVQREKDLENATLDGQLTASEQPDDLRVGDTIELAYTITRRDPATGGRSQIVLGPDDGLPYGRYRLRVTWPDTRSLQWHATPGVVQPQLTHTAAGNALTVDLVNVTTARAPSSAPARYGLVNLVELSEFPDWQSVSRTFAGLFAKAETTAPNGPLKREIARIAAASPDPLRRTELALQLVEDQVRYLFIGMDDGGFVPAPAELTWQRRYGDCKGKTALLVALLDGLGIKARPVLVNTTDGDATAHRLPAMDVFDHVIVEAQIGGRSYWLDGTRLGDRRLDRLTTPDYHAGLPATAVGDTLIPLEPDPPGEPQTVTSLNLDASQGIDTPALASAEIRVLGAGAADMRMKYAGLSSADLDRALRKLWRETYDFVIPDVVSAHEEPDTGAFVITARGKAKMDWYTSGAARWYEIDRARVGWKIETARDGELLSDAPYAFKYPDWWASHETIVLPQKGQGFALQSSDIATTVGGVFALHRTVRIAGGVVTMDNDTRALKAELPAADAETVRTDLQALANEGAFVRVSPGYMPTDTDLAALAADRPALARAHLQRGAVLVDRAEPDAAIPEEKAALALDPALGNAHALLALAYAMAEPGAANDTAALREADLAIGAGAGEQLAYAARGHIALRKGQPADAVASFDKVLMMDKTNLRALLERATAHLQLGHDAEALADLDAAQALQPQLPVESLRALALAGVGRREDALDEADKAMAESPDDRPTRRLRLRVRQETGDNAGALADAAYLLTHHPDAEDYLLHASLLPTNQGKGRDADFASALRLDPGNADAHLARARAALDAGKLDAAQADIDLAEQARPGALGVTALRLDLLAKRGRNVDALALAGDALHLHPADADALNMVCWFKATRNIALKSAVADCDAALQLAANSARILDSRAFARLREGDAKGAITDYNTALRIAPDQTPSLFGRGIARARLGERSRALADLWRARSVRPDIDAVWADYGIAPPAGFEADPVMAAK